jgi:hypothetical protein
MQITPDYTVCMYGIFQACCRLSFKFMSSVRTRLNRAEHTNSLQLINIKLT